MTEEEVGIQPERETATVVISRIRYARKFNLGNYQNEDIEAEALVAPGEDPAVVFAALKRFVQAHGPKQDQWGYTLPDLPGEDVP